VVLATSPAEPRLERHDGSVLMLYDGDCAFCSRCAAVLRRWVPAARIEAWQSVDLAPLGVTAQDCATAVQLIDGDRVSAGPVAIARLLRIADRWSLRVAGRLLGTRPVLVVAWPVYRWVARHRHRFPGATVACELPRVV
jgi:predicted DCC family thiol-disulfide oxidoreductase YuxK